MLLSRPSARAHVTWNAVKQLRLLHWMQAPVLSRQIEQSWWRLSSAADSARRANEPTDQLPPAFWDALDALDRLHVDGIADAHLGDPDRAEKMRPLRRGERGLLECAGFAGAENAVLWNARLVTIARDEIIECRHAPLGSRATRCTCGTAIDLPGYTGPHSSLCQRLQSLVRSSHEEAAPPTLVHGQIAPIAEHDGVGILALAVVADGTPRVLDWEGGRWGGNALHLRQGEMSVGYVGVCQSETHQIKPLLFEAVHDDLKHLVAELVDLLLLSLNVEHVQPFAVCLGGGIPSGWLTKVAARLPAHPARPCHTRPAWLARIRWALLTFHSAGARPHVSGKPRHTPMYRM